MDFILRHLNARGFLVLGGSAAALFLLARFHAAPVRWYEDRKFAAERGAALATDISRDLDARESLRLKGLYRDVSAEIAAARARGRPVGKLQAAADAALRMNTAEMRPFAIENLNRLRLAIPQPPAAVRPSAGGDEPPSDAPPAPPSSPIGSSRRRALSR